MTNTLVIHTLLGAEGKTATFVAALPACTNGIEWPKKNDTLFDENRNTVGTLEYAVQLYLQTNPENSTYSQAVRELLTKLQKLPSATALVIDEHHAPGKDHDNFMKPSIRTNYEQNYSKICLYNYPMYYVVNGADLKQYKKYMRDICDRKINIYDSKLKIYVNSHDQYLVKCDQHYWIIYK